MRNLFLLLLFISCSTVKTPSPAPHEPVVSPTEPTEDKVLFKVRSSLDLMKEATKVSNCVINLKSFRDELKSIEKFDYTEDNGEQVLSRMLNQPQCIASTYVTPTLSVYRCKVLATTYKGDSETFYVNTRSCVWPRSLGSIVGTFLHECSHLYGYSHGSNSSGGKQDAVGYVLGNLGEKYTSECVDN